MYIIYITCHNMAHEVNVYQPVLCECMMYTNLLLSSLHLLSHLLLKRGSLALCLLEASMLIQSHMHIYIQVMHPPFH